MALFYRGSRPVLRGQSDSDQVNPWTGKTGTYSNWQLMSRHSPLEGMPDHNVVPGAGLYPHDYKLSRIFEGLEDRTQPLNDPGHGARLEGFRWHPYEYKGIPTVSVFAEPWGHAFGRPSDYSVYSNYIKDGITSADPMHIPGHTPRRWEDPAAPSGFGRQDFYDHAIHAVSPAPLEATTFGEPVPEGHDNPYGHNRVREWSGVPSANALAT